MEIIDSDKAKNKYKISTYHQEMDNGELRFRLIKNDGATYIRTEAGSNASWQKSHYHKKTKETYIIQKGWIACAKMINGKCKIEIFKEDEIFTIKANTPHNIYMTKNSVIHTVKHGDVEKKDYAEAKKLDELIQNLNENQILSFATTDKNNSKEIYSKEYRHFDKLIWQVPVWSTAIFTAAIASGLIFISILNDNGEKIIVEFLNLEPRNIISAYFFIFSCILMMFSFVLYRFRVHQRFLGKYKKIPLYKSAQLYFQLVTCVEFLILLYLALIFGVQQWIGLHRIFYILLLFLLLWWMAELNLRKKCNIKNLRNLC